MARLVEPPGKGSHFVVRWLYYVSAALNRLAEWVTFAATFGMMLVMVVEVTRRTFLHGSFTWGFEVAVDLFLWASFAGCSVAYWRGELIGMDFAKDRVHGFGGVLLRGFMSLLVLGVLAVMIFYSLRFMFGKAVALQRGYTSGIPTIYTYAAFPFAFVIMLVHLFAHIAAEIGLFFREGKRP